MARANRITHVLAEAQLPRRDVALVIGAAPSSGPNLEAHQPPRHRARYSTVEGMTECGPAWAELKRVGWCDGANARTRVHGVCYLAASWTRLRHPLSRRRSRCTHPPRSAT